MRQQPHSQAPDARYSDYFEVGHNPIEFLLDFGHAVLAPQVPRIHSRIVLAPTTAKHLLEVLQRAVGEYEAECGALSLVPGGRTQERGPE